MTATPPVLQVAGIGVATTDYIATFTGFPQPDAKLRTNSLSIVPGGNIWNGLATLRRYGLSAKILTTVGNDANGAFVLEKLKEEGIGTNFVKTKAASSCFTYIIVDETTDTRTCLFTPGPMLEATDFDASFLNDASLLYADVRNARIIKKVADAAKQKGIPVLVDLEKHRGDITKYIVGVANYIVTNEAFPGLFSNETDLLAGISKIFRAGDPKFVATTLGARGVICVRRCDGTNRSPNAKHVSTFAKILAETTEKVVTKANFVKTAVSAFSYEDNGDSYSVLYCAAYPFPKEAIVDTTGAGDVFIGSLAYCVLQKMTLERALVFSSFAAGASSSSAFAHFDAVKGILAPYLEVLTVPFPHSINFRLVC